MSLLASLRLAGWSRQLPPSGNRGRYPLLACLALASAVGTSGATSAVAHDGHDHDQTDKKTATIGTGLVLPDIEGPKPWSDKPALTDPNRFSIAIMTDRTGGHRPGIWMKAVERLNWLRPDFVVSVGDLIEGYTEDDAQIAREWKEFLGFIDQMQMKFFFVAGNHDVTNPKLHRIWREQFGREWYSFDYKDVHFVCLSSEDPSAHLGDEQLAWLEHDLQQSKDARWTLLFLHKPLWVTAETEMAAGNADSTNWTKVAQMLGDRRHTVFAGHVHHYVQYQRRGTQYYSLATTGGSSPMRGVAYGEFDHVTWLTMEADGPHVANLLLDGIQPADVVTEDSIGRFHSFLRQVRLEVAPILIRGTELQSGDIRIRLQNEFDQPVKMRATLAGLPLVGLSMESQELELAVKAGEAMEQVVHFEMKSPVDLTRFAGTTLTAIIESGDQPPLRAEWTVPVVIDQEHRIPSEKVTVDGDVGEWDETWWQTAAQPELVGPVGQWTGPADASLQVSASYDAKQLVFAFKVDDDQIQEGDGVRFTVDPRPLSVRTANSRMGRESLSLFVAPPATTTAGECQVRGLSNTSTRGVTAVGKRTASGYEIEVSTPLSSLIRAQGENWTDFQLGARLSDVDAAKEQLLEVLWRSSADARQNRGFAHVIRSND